MEIGTVLTKPVDPEAFRSAMAWCCDPQQSGSFPAGTRIVVYAAS